MRQAMFNGPGDLAIAEGPVPTPARHDVLICVEACGVCGSDRAIYAGTHPAATPLVLGHEFSGTVVDTGPDVADIEIGDRVTVDPNITCGRCPNCRRGLVQLCQGIASLGITLPGGFAEYSLAPEPNAYRIRNSTSFDEASLVEPLACCVRGISQAGVQLGDVVVVLGAGPIGLLLVQLARLRGAVTTICVDPVDRRRDLARSLGVDVVIEADETDVREAVAGATDGLGADAVLESSGQTAVAQFALELVRAGGTVVWFGACPQNDQVLVRPFHVNEREITIRGSNINPFTHQTALSLIEHGRVRISELISDCIGLGDLAAVLGGGSPSKGKIVVHPGERP